MRHGNSIKKFDMKSAHRQAMLRSMATSLLLHERCETTVARAKELRRVVERLITMGREDTLGNRRQAYGYLRSKAVVHKLFADVGPRFKTRPGGYTRIVRSGYRHGDAAPMAYIELLQEVKKIEQAAPKEKKKAAPKKAAATEPKAEKAAKADAPKKAAPRKKAAAKA